MLLYLGPLKKIDTNWEEYRYGEAIAAQYWPTIEAWQTGHPILWAAAPFTPPYFLLNEDSFNSFIWLFVKVNWLFLFWCFVSAYGARYIDKARRLFKLIDQLNEEEQLDEMRRQRYGNVLASRVVIELRSRVEKTSKWWDLNLAIVGGALALILGTAILIELCKL
jgi:hypothetical protein